MMTANTSNIKHVTKCIDNGLEGDLEYECVWCSKPTKRLDLDYESPLHPGCSKQKTERMLQLHWITMTILKLLGYKNC